jgi:hypothetical protein
MAVRKPLNSRLVGANSARPPTSNPSYTQESIRTCVTQNMSLTPHYELVTMIVLRIPRDGTQARMISESVKASTVGFEDT